MTWPWIHLPTVMTITAYGLSSMFLTLMITDEDVGMDGVLIQCGLTPILATLLYVEITVGGVVT